MDCIVSGAWRPSAGKVEGNWEMVPGRLEPLPRQVDPDKWGPEIWSEIYRTRWILASKKTPHCGQQSLRSVPESRAVGWPVDLLKPHLLLKVRVYGLQTTLLAWWDSGKRRDSSTVKLSISGQGTAGTPAPSGGPSSGAMLHTCRRHLHHKPACTAVPSLRGRREGVTAAPMTMRVLAAEKWNGSQDRPGGVSISWILV